jgi:hypothetical protein
MITVVDVFNQVFQVPAAGIGLGSDLLAALPQAYRYTDLYIECQRLEPSDPIPRAVSLDLTPVIAVSAVEMNVSPVTDSIDASECARFSHIYYPMGVPPPKASPAPLPNAQSSDSGEEVNVDDTDRILDDESSDLTEDDLIESDTGGNNLVFNNWALRPLNLSASSGYYDDVDEGGEEEEETES